MTGPSTTACGSPGFETSVKFLKLPYRSDPIIYQEAQFSCSVSTKYPCVACVCMFGHNVLNTQIWAVAQIAMVANNLVLCIGMTLVVT